MAADDGLPPWLRELQGAQPPYAPSGYGPPPAAPYGIPNMAGGYRQQPSAYPQPQPGFAGYAGSPQGYGQMGQAGQTPQDYGQPPSHNMQASDLVSAEALPEWLRNVASGPLSGSNGNGRAGAYPAPPAGNGWGVPAEYGQPGQPGAPAGPRYAPNAGNGAAPGMSGPLESGQLGFGQPASTLFDESALPDWLRQASMGQEIEVAPPARQQVPGTPPAHPGYGAPGGSAAIGAGGTGYSEYQAPQASPAFQASAFPPLDQAGAYQAAPPSPEGMSGRSLLDSGALPPWMGGHPGAPAPSSNGMPSNPGGMSAQSLVDESALPQWLRAEPNVPAAPPAPSYGTQGSLGSPSAQGASSWLSSPASTEPMPQWLNQVYADANVPRAEPRPANSPMTPMTGGFGAPGSGMLPGGGSRNLTGGTVSASDFVDESALPDWLKSQGAVENAPPPYAPPNPSVRPASAALPEGTVPEHRIAPRYHPAGAPGNEPQSHFAASDLIDPSALPEWVTAQNPAPAPSFSSATGWTAKQPAAAPSAEDDEEAWQSGGRYSRARQPRGYNSSYGRMPDVPEAELDRRGAGNGIGRRRGPPIPNSELPSWLQGTGGRQAGWEDDAQEAAAQWDDWDDDSYADDGNGYARQDEYAQDDYDAEPAHEQRGGWRRIFGRK